METRSGTDRGPTYDPSTNAPSAPPEKASLIEDFIDIFYAPSKVFARREKSGFGMAFLLISIISAAFAFASRSVLSQIIDAQIAKQMADAMAKDPRITPDVLEKMRPFYEAIGNATMYVITPITILVTALVIWVVTKIFSGKLTLGQAGIVATLGWIPRLAAGLLVAIQVVLTDMSNVRHPMALTFSAARFMNPETTNPKLLALVGTFDVFSIWYCALIAIGVAVIGKLPRTRAYAVGAIVFALGTLVLVAGAK